MNALQWLPQSYGQTHAGAYVEGTFDLGGPVGAIEKRPRERERQAGTIELGSHVSRGPIRSPYPCPSFDRTACADEADLAVPPIARPASLPMRSLLGATLQRAWGGRLNGDRTMGDTRLSRPHEFGTG